MPHEYLDKRVSSSCLCEETGGKGEGKEAGEEMTGGPEETLGEETLRG